MHHEYGRLTLATAGLLFSEAQCSWCINSVQVALLESTVASLLEVSSGPLALSDAVQHSQRDIAQVHAVNILRILVQDSSLATATSQYHAALTMHALNGFTSPLWAVRNASLQLLGYLSFYFLFLFMLLF